MSPTLTERVARALARQYAIDDGLDPDGLSDDAWRDFVSPAEVAIHATGVEPLVEALDFYAANHQWPNEGPWGVDSADFGNVARQALDAWRGG